uniref:Uncharacterized protein n=1 Tax=Leersia perrieri TaxID=77586 RepID=A0A0D9WPA2_9ORYZ
MMRCPYRNSGALSEEELANRSETFRQFYTIKKFIGDKMNEYERTLIDQYIKKGYAENEVEVTHDEEEEKYMRFKKTVLPDQKQVLEKKYC